MLSAFEEHRGSVTFAVLVMERPPDTPVAIGLTCLEGSQCLAALKYSPFKETAVRSVSRILIDGTSSLVSSQTKGSGTALAGKAVANLFSE